MVGAGVVGAGVVGAGVAGAGVVGAGVVGAGVVGVWATLEGALNVTASAAVARAATVRRSDFIFCMCPYIVDFTVTSDSPIAAVRSIQGEIQTRKLL